MTILNNMILFLKLGLVRTSFQSLENNKDVKMCLILWDSVDCSPPGSSVPGISQARILEWIAISWSRGSSRARDQICVFCLAGRFFITEPPGKPHNLNILAVLFIMEYNIKINIPTLPQPNFPEALTIGDGMERQ